MTSTSTVGLPRESRISRPWMWMMSLMGRWGNTGRDVVEEVRAAARTKTAVGRGGHQRPDGEGARGAVGGVPARRAGRRLGGSTARDEAARATARAAARGRGVRRRLDARR